jgi:SAM-dependent methyltransferase
VIARAADFVPDCDYRFRKATAETPMENANHVDGGQGPLWNGAAGRAWVELQDLVEQTLKPIGDLLLEAAFAQEPQSRISVLDVGCGPGATTLAAARRLGAKGRCVGLDISDPMIAAARARAEREGSSATFIHADAQTYAFEPASFDMIISRFGVMFFDDPVRAFANLRHATVEGGEMRLITWRSAAENPFMTTAERAAAPLLPDIPARQPDAPGQFAFADERRVSSILTKSGWTHIVIHPCDVACTLPEKELVRYLTRMGPVGRALEGADEATRARVIDAIRPAFDRYVRGSEAQFTAACWVVGARASAVG